MKNTLIKHIKISLSNEEKAFTYVFEKYYKPLVLFANQFVPEIETCEDLVQDLMANILTNKNEFLNESSLRSYLYTSVKNKALNHIRFQKTYSKYISLQDTKQTDHKNQMEIIIEKEVHSLLYDSIDMLPERCKLIFKLNVLENFSYKETAEKLNITINTVKTQRARAIKILKQNLGKYFMLVLIFIRL